jgi:hypothetical protein
VAAALSDYSFAERLLRDLAFRSSYLMMFLSNLEGAMLKRRLQSQSIDPPVFIRV